MVFIVFVILLFSYGLYMYKPKTRFKISSTNVDVNQVAVKAGKEIYRAKTDLSDFIYISVDEFVLIDNNKLYFFRNNKLIQTIQFETTFEINVLRVCSDMIVIYSPHIRKVVVYKHDRNMYWYEFQSIVDPMDDNSSGFGCSMNYCNDKLFIGTRINCIYTYTESSTNNYFYLHSVNKVDDNVVCVLNDKMYISSVNSFRGVELDSKVKFFSMVNSGVILLGTQFKLYVFLNSKHIDVYEMNQTINRYIYDDVNNKLCILFNYSWIEVSLKSWDCTEYILENKDMIVCSNRYCITKEDVLFDIIV